MIDLKDFKECPIGEYVRILSLKDTSLETLTDQELWVLYTKALDDSTSEVAGKLGLQSRAAERATEYEGELVNRGIFKTSQVSIFEGDN